MSEEESTTPDLVELARRACDCLERRDYDAALSCFADDPVWDMSAMGMGVFEGRVPVRGLLEDWNGPYDEWEIELEDFLQLGNGVVYVVVMERARPTGSTGRVQLRYAAVVVFAEEMIAHAKTYPDIDEARAAAERLAEERNGG
ncbi:MAG: nuclear transport factor 2 family protein [Solirubrobacteraceae bacterium]